MVRHILSILALPFNATVVIPVIILWETSGLNRPWNWAITDSLWYLIPGLYLILKGVAIWGWTVWLFAQVGKGTLAPWDPPQHLVVKGPYGHVRNPMISGICLVLLGEALITHSLPLFIFFIFFALGNHFYLRFFEEPGLVERFGEEYEEYRENVPEWIPRFTPWRPEEEEVSD